MERTNTKEEIESYNKWITDNPEHPIANLIKKQLEAGTYVEMQVFTPKHDIGNTEPYLQTR